MLILRGKYPRYFTSSAGFGDPLFRISMILVGTRAPDARDFFKVPKKKFNLGFQYRVRPPLGQTSVSGVEQEDLQKTSRYGAAFAYQFMWFDRK